MRDVLKTAEIEKFTESQVKRMRVDAPTHALLSWLVHHRLDFVARSVSIEDVMQANMKIAELQTVNVVLYISGG
eukprot:5634029-Pleurochrysis_carterae.AAC.1